MFPIIFASLAVIVALVRIFIFKISPAESFLLGFLFFSVGLQGVFAFIGHYFRSDEIAKKIGWQTGNPFQKELAFSNLRKNSRSQL
ncbi:DUF6790 family protein [Candidatus Omnitrophota bacterium]